MADGTNEQVIVLNAIHSHCVIIGYLTVATKGISFINRIAYYTDKT